MHSQSIDVDSFREYKLTHIVDHMNLVRSEEAPNCFDHYDRKKALHIKYYIQHTSIDLCLRKLRHILSNNIRDIYDLLMIQTLPDNPKCYISLYVRGRHNMI